MKIPVAILLATAISVFAQSAPYGGIPFHPYRKADGRYCDLRWLYEWADLSPKERREFERPLKSWRVEDGSDGYSCYVLSVVIGEGLLLEKDHEAFCFIKNYPGSDDKVDGLKIKFIALRIGNYQYKSAGGGVKTVPMYDYGIPYDPDRLAAEARRTNSVARPSSR